MAKRKKQQIMRPKPQKIIRPPKPVIRISQCMIVKNEEKNIERALSWGKDIVYEQIVVDTGSTDRTVEIAESMGAKVFHFEWINDFSAAKNFAIDQAKGNWIAFLDADEYFTPEDAKKLMIFLNAAEAPEYRNECLALTCTLANLDDDNKPFSIYEQDRIFRNLPYIRYEGKIHEILSIREGAMKALDITIMHTGYSKTAYAEGEKAERNVKMIRERYDADPEDPDLMCYLADSLRIDMEPEHLLQAEELYHKAIRSTRRCLPPLLQNAYNFLITRHIDDGTQETFELAQKAVTLFPESPDFAFYFAVMLNMSGNYIKAWEYFVKCENLLKASNISTSLYIHSHPSMLFFQMVTTAEALGDRENMIRCATLLLREDKYQQGILAPYLSALSAPESHTTMGEIMQLLEKLYDLNNIKDKLCIITAAREAGCTEIMETVLNTLTKAELDWLSGED